MVFQDKDGEDVRKEGGCNKGKYFCLNSQNLVGKANADILFSGSSPINPLLVMLQILLHFMGYLQVFWKILYYHRRHWGGLSASGAGVENVMPSMSPQMGVHTNFKNQFACALCGYVKSDRILTDNRNTRTWCRVSIWMNHISTNENAVSHVMKETHWDLKFARIWWILEFSFGRFVSRTVTWEGNNRSLV